MADRAKKALGTLALTLAMALPLVQGPAMAAEEKWLPPLVIHGKVNEGLWLYGQINKGLLVADDGGVVRGYPLVDNANSSTRAGIWYRASLDRDFVFSANLEYEWNPYSTGRVNRLNREDVDWETNKMRKAEGILASPYGTLWLGQGSTASDGSSESDLSGTSVIAYSSVADSAGGQRFVDSAGLISRISVGSAFSNLDGQGRLTRIRYDTPEFEGFTLKTSAGFDAISGDDQIGWDLAGAYRKSVGEYDVQAAVAFARPGGNFNRYNGSASVLHKPTGLNATFAIGTDDRNSRDPFFFYGKLGWKPELTDAGPTAFAVDFFSGDDMNTAGSESLAVGLAAVQTLDYYNTDFYLTARWYDYDDRSANYEGVVALLTGIRLRF